MLSRHPTVTDGRLELTAHRPAPVRDLQRRDACTCSPAGSPAWPSSAGRSSSTPPRTAAARTRGCWHEQADDRRDASRRSAQGRRPARPPRRADADGDDARAGLHARGRAWPEDCRSRCRRSTTENVDSLLDHLSGLLLTGGPDLDPACYGAEPHPELGPTDRDVDAFEIALCRQADRRGMPILGICRGAQVLNVARAGHAASSTCPTSTDGAVEHRQAEPGDRTTHEVRVAPDSGLAQTTGGGPVKVNSFHHQAIDRLGLGLRAVAWAEDGVIEAVEGGRRALRAGRAVARRDARRRSRAAGAVRAPGRGGEARRRSSDSARAGRSGLRRTGGLRCPRSLSALAPARARRVRAAGAWSQWAPAGVDPVDGRRRGGGDAARPRRLVARLARRRGDVATDRRARRRTRAPRRTARRSSCAPIRTRPSRRGWASSSTCAASWRGSSRRSI